MHAKSNSHSSFSLIFNRTQHKTITEIKGHFKMLCYYIIRNSLSFKKGNNAMVEFNKRFVDLLCSPFWLMSQEINGHRFTSQIKHNFRKLFFSPKPIAWHFKKHESISRTVFVRIIFMHGKLAFCDINVSQIFLLSTPFNKKHGMNCYTGIIYISCISYDPTDGCVSGNWQNTHPVRVCFLSKHYPSKPTTRTPRIRRAS